MADSGMALVQEITQMVVILANPAGYSAEDMARANRRLNEILQHEMVTNVQLYLDTAMTLMVSNHQNETLVFYGYQMAETLIRHQWYKMPMALRMQLKNHAIDRATCDQLNHRSSPLILNTCSRFITEIFIRDWPNYWQEFWPKILQTESAVKMIPLYTILNISDYLQKLLIPNNGARRREIIKCLIGEKKTLVQYLLQAISVSDRFGTNVIVSKALEAIDSLMEWYPLDKELLLKVIDLTIDSSSCSILAYRVIQTVIRRPQAKTDDTFLTVELFYDLHKTKFAHFLITNELRLRFFKDSDAETFQLFLLTLDISVEIICRVIGLYNQECSPKMIRENCNQNQTFWLNWLTFCFELLEFNNISVDEILLRFIRLYSRLHPTGSQQPADAKFLVSPISADINESVPFKLIMAIGLLKLEPRPESEVMKMSFNIDSYDTYQRMFHENKCNFCSCLMTLCQTYPELGPRYTILLLEDILNASNNETGKTRTGVSSWKSAAFLLSSLVPKLTFTAEQTSVMEICFGGLLRFIKDSGQDPKTLSFVLSCLSSMSNLYPSFRCELIQQFIDGIFYQITKKDTTTDLAVIELQNHASALFIKLTKTRHDLLVPYFPMMVAYIDNLIQKEQISLMTSYFLYDGLFILSNHLPIAEQEAFVRNHFLPQIAWITSYDQGPDGEQFFRDIGLSLEPTYDGTNQFPPGHRTLAKMTAVINLLNRVHKRIDSHRCHQILWANFLQYLTPFYTMVANIHRLWGYHDNGDQARLDQLCHPFYQPCLFEEIPLYYMTHICADQQFLLPPDRYKILLKQWNRESPPPAELVARQMQHRFWVLYSQSVTYLGTALNNLMLFHTTQPTLAPIIENYIGSQNAILCTNMRYMPIFVHHDLIRLYFQCLATYCPRSEPFLSASGTGETLTQFLSFMFAKLNEYLMAIQNGELIIGGPRRSLSTVTTGGSKSFTDNNNEKNCLEICFEAIVRNVCGDFVSLLEAIFSPAKSVANIINDNNDRHMDDTEMDLGGGAGDDDDGNGEVDHPNLNNRQPNQTGESGRPRRQDQETRNDTENEEENETKRLLSWFMMKHNPKPLAMMVIGCLQWPIGNLKRQICQINQKLFCSLLAMNLIGTVDAFYDLAGRILQAMAQTERADIETFNSLVTLLYMIYKDFVSKHHDKNVIVAVNRQLSGVCGTSLDQWDKFGQGFRQKTPVDAKKGQKMLRLLVENVTDKGLSSATSNTTTGRAIFSLGMMATDKKVASEDDIISTGNTFLSWL